MKSKLKSFLASEDGAVTVDWVVLTALVVGVQILILLTPMRNALVSNSEAIGDVVAEYQVFLEE